MIKHRELYMKLWIECIKTGWTTQDARDYAQMVVNEQIEAENIAMKTRQIGLAVPSFVKPKAQFAQLLGK
jgi:hypothetical protein